MADQPTNQNTSDEIDLGQLFQLIRKGFNKFGNFFLRVFLYLKKNAVVLISLFIVGALIGYGLNFVTEEKEQIDVIVKPNLESKDYLYDVVEEIESNLKDKNEPFFNEMEISIDELKGFKIAIAPVKEEIKKADKELEYLQVLQKFENTDLVSDALREEVLKNSELNHRITFFYKSDSGYDIAKKLMEYINSNAYFNELIATKAQNSMETIERNERSIAQIDTLVTAYSQKMKTNTESAEIGKIVLDNEEQLNVSALLNLKIRMIEEIQSKRMELKTEASSISIVNFGRPHKSIKPLFGKNIVLIPTILVSLFFLVSFLRYLNRKAMELEKG